MKRDARQNCSLFLRKDCIFVGHLFSFLAVRTSLGLYATPDLTEKLNFLALTNTKEIRTLSDTMCILISPKQFVRSITKVFMAIYSKKVFEL